MSIGGIVSKVEGGGGSDYPPPLKCSFHYFYLEASKVNFNYSRHRYRKSHSNSFLYVFCLPFVFFFYLAFLFLLELLLVWDRVSINCIFAIKTLFFFMKTTRGCCLKRHQPFMKGKIALALGFL